MAKRKVVPTPEASEWTDPPAVTPEGREDQLIAMAVNLAQKQLREGTASSQVITHYLKLGSMRAKLQSQLLKKQTQLLQAKTQSIKSSKQIEQMYRDAINAMRRYSGSNQSDENYTNVL